MKVFKGTCLEIKNDLHNFFKESLDIHFLGVSWRIGAIPDKYVLGIVYTTD